LDTEARAGKAVRALINEGFVTAVHDVSDGGISVALAEMALASGIGASVMLEPYPGASGGMFFGEDQAVYVVTCPSTVDVTELIERLNAFGVVGEVIGETGGSTLELSGMNNTFEIPLAELRVAHEGFFPKLMGADAALA
jgi:phosphoribosylformylglycinamidine synthase